MSSASSLIRRTLDRAGIWLSSLCLLHCLLSIIVVSVLGIGGQFFFAPEIHRYGLALALIIAAVAIGWGGAASSQGSAIRDRNDGPHLHGRRSGGSARHL